jgi:pilus assembly protein FimV
MDLSTISLDLGMAGDAPAAGAEANADPKWQEVATKLDLAKAYEEMGDKDGARELLNEVVREGDAAQQGQAQQLLAKLG